MRRAIELARQSSIVEKAGGPFGCVIVKDGAIISEGANHVIRDKDPTSHGELNAIRAACKKLGTHDLSGCDIYTTGEPCPMCYAACWWARVETIYYASTVQDAKQYGDFDDQLIVESMKDNIENRKVTATQLLVDEMLALWKEFHNSKDRVHY